MDEFNRNEERPRKSSVWKWVLGGCLGITVLFLIGVGVLVYLVSKSVTQDPQRVQEIAHGIYPLPIPTGLKGEFAMDAPLGIPIRMALLSGDSNLSPFTGIVLVRGPADQASKEKLIEEMREALEEEGKEQETTGEETMNTFRLRDRDVTATVSRIKEKDSGRLLNQYLLPLREGSDTVLLVFLGTQEKLTPDELQKYLDTVPADQPASP